MRAILTTLFLAASLLADGPYLLPDDPNAVILSLSYRRPGDGTEKRPAFIKILANGRIQARDVDRVMEGRIDSGIIRDVLREIVGRQRIFDWDAERVAAALRKAAGTEKPLLQVAGANTAVLRVRLKDRAIELRQRALETAVKLYPAIADLRRLLTAVRRLELEANILRAGGRGAVARVIGVAYPKLEAGGDDRLRMTELNSVRRRRDGTVLMTFRRETARGRLEIQAQLDYRGAAAAQLKDHRKRYALPAQGVVLSLDYRDGYGPQRMSEDPCLSVLADGTVTAHNVDAPGNGRKGKLSDSKLQDLLHFIVEEQRFFDWDQPKMAAKLLKRRGAYIYDVPTTVVRVRLRKKENVAEVSALGYLVECVPRIAEVARLVAAERRLKREMNVILVGEESRARDLLKLANASLEESHPTVPPLTLDDLAFVGHGPDGLFLSFRRLRRGKDLTRVTVLVTRTRKPVVRIQLKPAMR